MGRRFPRCPVLVAGFNDQPLFASGDVMPTTTVLTGPWGRSLQSLVGSARRHLTVCAPYISEAGADTIKSAMSEQIAAELDVLILTDLSPNAVCSGATDPAALASIVELFPHSRPVHLPRLHAKVYTADGRRAIVTSGNLTRGGLKDNYECGVLLEAGDSVRAIEYEIGAYAALGGTLDPSTLARVCDLADEARRAYRAQASSAAKQATRRLAEVMQRAGDTLIRARLAGGSVQSVLARTIEYLLRRHGPLTTVQLNPLVQQIHTDLCDDAVDRVIDGERFGRKWKHAVRNAQQQLKRRGAIVWNNGVWSLVAP